MITTGLEALLADHLPELRNKRVGILANHASVTGSLVHISDALNAEDISISAMFGPEHGARGDLAEGVHVEDGIDERLLIPIYSLYGATTRPNGGSLHGIDVMLVDLQDIGARFYTFLYTMGEVMRACGERKIPVWVLDRPNPISGAIAEGPVSEPGFSYVTYEGDYSLMIRHGLTIGELARLFVTRFGVDCELRVIPMRGWDRSMWYGDTGLPWIMPSPNMPTFDTALVYPGACLIEGTNVSEGRGTTRPFELMGAPWIDAPELRLVLDAAHLPGVAFREAYFVPQASKYCGEQCAGLQIHVTDRTRFRPVLTAVALVSVLYQLHPKKLQFRSSGNRLFFDILCGTDSVRKAILNEDSPFDTADSWLSSRDAFEKESEAVRLY